MSPLATWNRVTMRRSLMFLTSTLLPQLAFSQVRVHPTGVNVNAQGATTVFLTFGGLVGHVPAEAFWCGELMPAAPDRGLKCDPATLYGRSALRYDRSRVSGTGGLTDIMSIPPSVARRAYQDAQTGSTSSFFYVRRFVSVTGGPDEYVSVTCRMGGGGARVPLALLNVTLSFDVETPVLYVEAGEQLPAVSARILYNGTGRLKGRWEVVRPGDVMPEEIDLLTEATLPLEQRGTQRRYAELSRFNVFLPPDGSITLDGPPPDRIPSEVGGAYLLLLRIEASDDKEGDSDLGLAGAGAGIVHAGAVAGFPIPSLRYAIGSGGSELSPRGIQRALAQRLPSERALVPRDSTIRFAWTDSQKAAFYRLVIEDEGGRSVLSAVTGIGVRVYTAPPFLAERAAGATTLRWRVVALDDDGRELRKSGWRRFTFP